MIWVYACGADITVRPCLSLFHIVNFHFSSLIYRQWVPREHNSSYNFMPIFAHVFSIVWRCACAFDIILALIFITFFYLWTSFFCNWCFVACEMAFCLIYLIVIIIYFQWNFHKWSLHNYSYLSITTTFLISQYIKPLYNTPSLLRPVLSH